MNDIKKRQWDFLMESPTLFAYLIGLALFLPLCGAFTHIALAASGFKTDYGSGPVLIWITTVEP